MCLVLELDQVRPSRLGSDDMIGLWAAEAAYERTFEAQKTAKSGCHSSNLDGLSSGS